VRRRERSLPERLRECFRQAGRSQPRDSARGRGRQALVICLGRNGVGKTTSIESSPPFREGVKGAALAADTFAPPRSSARIWASGSAPTCVRHRARRPARSPFDG